MLAGYDKNDVMFSQIGQDLKRVWSQINSLKEDQVRIGEFLIEHGKRIKALEEILNQLQYLKRQEADKIYTLRDDFDRHISNQESHKV